MFTKSSVAFSFSANRPMMRYFWTFTTRVPVWGKQIGYEWNKLLSRMRKAKIPLRGVRVFELHPGGHGFHVHALTTEYVNVKLLRKALPRPWGRVQVEPISGNATAYLSKYLAKKDQGIGRGRRRWACFGGYAGTKVSDVEAPSLNVSREYFPESLKTRAARELLGLYSCLSNSSVSSRPSYKRGLRYLRDGRFQLARIALESAVRRSSRHNPGVQSYLFAWC